MSAQQERLILNLWQQRILDKFTYEKLVTERYRLFPHDVVITVENNDIQERNALYTNEEKMKIVRENGL